MCQNAILSIVAFLNDVPPRICEPIARSFSVCKTFSSWNVFFENGVETDLNTEEDANTCRLARSFRPVLAVILREREE